MTDSDSCVLETRPTHVYVRLLPTMVDQSWDAIDGNGQRLSSVLESANPPTCLVDLSELNYMGSAMVAFIVRAWKVVRGRNGKMAVVCPHPDVSQVIHVAGLDRVWTVCVTTTEAYESLGVVDPAGTGKKAGGSVLLLWLTIIALLVGAGCAAAVRLSTVPMLTLKQGYVGSVTLLLLLSAFNLIRGSGGLRTTSLVLFLMGGGMLVPMFMKPNPLFQRDEHIQVPREKNTAEEQDSFRVPLEQQPDPAAASTEP